MTVLKCVCTEERKRERERVCESMCAWVCCIRPFFLRSLIFCTSVKMEGEHEDTINSDVVVGNEGSKLSHLTVLVAISIFFFFSSPRQS